MGYILAPLFDSHSSQPRTIGAIGMQWSGRGCAFIQNMASLHLATLHTLDMTHTPGIVAALFIETGGCYTGLPGVDPWDITRDARQYAGPWPVVAHPPCQRWGRFWHGSPCKPHQYKLGDDQGCFASALASVRQWGGVLEHPADSQAWKHHGIPAPKRGAGWLRINAREWTCYVEQGHYGHVARKGTWLFYVGSISPPALTWSRLPQRLDPVLLARYGYQYARRAGMVAMIGGKRKTELRNATPPAFRDVLLALAKDSA